MTQIQILTDFVQLLSDTKQSLENFNTNFENEIFDAFNGADECLKIIYGDYMTPPPVEQQMGLHVVEAYQK